MRNAKAAEWIDKGSAPNIVFEKLELKVLQKAILNCLQKHDVVANMPTGFGKSLLFQYPASKCCLNKQCALVIVPLKALVWDCIREAQIYGIVAKQLDHSLIEAYHQKDQLPQMIVLTPEKIFASESSFYFLETLYSQNAVKLVVIDECHCICEWGHDFRPAYLRLSEIRQIFVGVRLLAMSATIPPELKNQISTRLSLQNSFFFQASYHRPNLQYGVLKINSKSQACQAIVGFIKDKQLQEKCGIIYCQTIKGSQQLTRQLKKNGIKAESFHSKLSQLKRKQVYDAFMKGSIHTIVGTICFGMGINKKNIRYVLHLGVSKSPQNYYQESGRAGRDGIKSYCFILAFKGMQASLAFLIAKGEGNIKRKKHQYFKLDQIVQFTFQNYECRRRSLFKLLGEDFNETLCAKGCDICCTQENHKQQYKTKDFTEEVKSIILNLQQANRQFLTHCQLRDLLKGKRNERLMKFNKKQCFESLNLLKGKLKCQKQSTIDMIIDKMVFQKYLLKSVKFKKYGSVSYLKVSPKTFTNKLDLFEIKMETSLKKGKSLSTNSFDKYLSKKVQGSEKVQNKSWTQPQIKNDINSQQLFEGNVLKQKIDCQLFLEELFAQEIQDNNGQVQNGSQSQQVKLSEKQEQQLLMEIMQESNLKQKKQKEEEVHKQEICESIKKIIPIVSGKRESKKLKRNLFDFL